MVRSRVRKTSRAHQFWNVKSARALQETRKRAIPASPRGNLLMQKTAQMRLTHTAWVSLVSTKLESRRFTTWKENATRDRLEKNSSKSPFRNGFLKLFSAPLRLFKMSIRRRSIVLLPVVMEKADWFHLNFHRLNKSQKRLHPRQSELWLTRFSSDSDLYFWYFNETALVSDWRWHFNENHCTFTFPYFSHAAKNFRRWFYSL